LGRNAADSNPVQFQEETELKVDHFSRGSESARTMAWLNLPSQIHEGPLGVTLKRDLIEDDLLLQAAKGLEKGDPEQASRKVNEWIQSILSPCFNQFESVSSQPALPRAKLPRQRHRPAWKLWVQSVLLIPWVTGRNLYRRLRGRYPVL